MPVGVGPVCVYVSTGQGESSEATGARCDDRRSLGLKIELCSQRRETEERRDGRRGEMGEEGKRGKVKGLKEGWRGRRGH